MLTLLEKHECFHIQALMLLGVVSRTVILYYVLLQPKTYSHCRDVLRTYSSRLCLELQRQRTQNNYFRRPSISLSPVPVRYHRAVFSGMVVCSCL